MDSYSREIYAITRRFLEGSGLGAQSARSREDDRKRRRIPALSVDPSTAGRNPLYSTLVATPPQPGPPTPVGPGPIPGGGGPGPDPGGGTVPPTVIPTTGGGVHIPGGGGVVPGMRGTRRIITAPRFEPVSTWNEQATQGGGGSASAPSGPSGPFGPSTTTPSGGGGSHMPNGGAFPFGLSVPAIIQVLAPLLRQDEVQYSVPLDDFPIVDRFANGSPEGFWFLPAGSVMTENAGEGQASISVGSRMMIGSRSYTDVYAEFILGTPAPDASDGVLIRANLQGSINGYCLRYETETDNLLLLKIAAGIETILFSYGGGVGLDPGTKIGLEAIGTTLKVYIGGIEDYVTADATFAEGYVGWASFALAFTTPITSFTVESR